VDYEKVFKLFLTIATLREHKLLRTISSEYTVNATKTRFTYHTSRSEDGPTPISGFDSPEAPLDGEDKAIVVSKKLVHLMYGSVAELYRIGFLV